MCLRRRWKKPFFCSGKGWGFAGKPPEPSPSLHPAPARDHDHYLTVASKTDGPDLFRRLSGREFRRLSRLCFPRRRARDRAAPKPHSDSAPESPGKREKARIFCRRIPRPLPPHHRGGAAARGVAPHPRVDLWPTPGTAVVSLLFHLFFSPKCMSLLYLLLLIMVLLNR